jgi:hypothetical protein
MVQKRLARDVSAILDVSRRDLAAEKQKGGTPKGATL